MSESSGKTLLLDLCPEPRLPQTAYLRRAFAMDRRLQYYQVTDLKQAIPVLQKADSALIYFEVSKKEHIVNLIILLSAAGRLIQKGLCKSIGFNLMAKGAEQIEAMLKQKGVSEVAAARTSEKGILHKINRFYEAIQLMDSRRRPSAAQSAGGGGKQASLEWVNSLTIPNDYWMLQRLTDVKFRRETWMFNLIGPPPSFGKWELDRSLKSGGMDAWVWTPRKAGTPGAAGADELGSGLRSVMSAEDGKWIFWGNPPQFSSQNYMWLFVSRNPRFAFYSRANPKEPFVKMGLQDSKLRIAKNSPSAGKFVSEIQASLTAEVRFKGSQGARTSRELEISIEKKHKDFNNLEFAIEKEMESGGPLGEVNFMPADGPGLDLNSQGPEEEALDFKPGDGGTLDYSQESGDSGEVLDFSADQITADSPPDDSLDQVGADESFNFSHPQEASSQSSDNSDDNFEFGQDEAGFNWEKSGASHQGKSGSENGTGDYLDERDAQEPSTFTFGNGKRKAKIIPGGAKGSSDGARTPSITVRGVPTGGKTTVDGGQSAEHPEVIPGAEGGTEPYEKLFQELNFRILVTPVVGVAGQNKPISAKFLDLYETQLSLEISGATLRRGQLVTVQFIVENAQPPLDFSTRGKVMELESSNGETMVIGFEIEPVDPKLIERFMAVFQERQQHVTEFLYAAKGGR